MSIACKDGLNLTLLLVEAGVRPACHVFRKYVLLPDVIGPDHEYLVLYTLDDHGTYELVGFARLHLNFAGMAVAALFARRGAWGGAVQPPGTEMQLSPKGRCRVFLWTQTRVAAAAMPVDAAGAHEGLPIFLWLLFAGLRDFTLVTDFVVKSGLEGLHSACLCLACVLPPALVRHTCLLRLLRPSNRPAPPTAVPQLQGPRALNPSTGLPGPAYATHSVMPRLCPAPLMWHLHTGPRGFPDPLVTHTHRWCAALPGLLPSVLLVQCAAGLRHASCDRTVVSLRVGCLVQCCQLQSAASVAPAPLPVPAPPSCISYALVQATVGVGTVIIL